MSNFTKLRPLGFARTGGRINTTNTIRAFRDYVEKPINHASLWFPLVRVLTVGETAAY
jgi:hypothetical protein